MIKNLSCPEFKTKLNSSILDFNSSCPEFKTKLNSSDFNSKNKLNKIVENDKEDDNILYKLVDIYCYLSEFGGNIKKIINFKIYKKNKNKTIKFIIDKKKVSIPLNLLRIVCSVKENIIIFTANNKDINDYAPTFELSFEKNDFANFLNILYHIHNHN